MYTYYNRYHSVPKSFSCCCSGRDSCMLTSRCVLPWLRSAPYPALCPCEPLRPVGGMQAVSYGARSRQYSPLLPASSSQPRSIVERPRSGPMGRVHTCIYEVYLSAIQAFRKRPRHAYKHTLPRLAINSERITATSAREGFVSMCACTEPVRTGIGAVCVEYGRPKWPITMLNHTDIPGTE